MVEIADAVETARQHVLAGLDPGSGPAGQGRGQPSGAAWTPTSPELARLFHGLYGTRTDWLDQLTALVQQAARSWAERPAELKALDADREQDSGWFLSNEMLGGVCYVDRYAGNLEVSAPGSRTSRNSASRTCT